LPCTYLLRGDRRGGQTQSHRGPLVTRSAVVAGDTLVAPILLPPPAAAAAAVAAAAAAAATVRGVDALLPRRLRRRRSPVRRGPPLPPREHLVARAVREPLESS
jgi:hypothetical protein